jgi:hypothetical protein
MSTEQRGRGRGESVPPEGTEGEFHRRSLSEHLFGERALLWPSPSAAAILLERVTSAASRTTRAPFGDNPGENKTMACCGQRRQQLRASAIPVRPGDNPPNAAAIAQSSVQQQSATFQYVGKTAMTAIGLVSGRQYRFGYPGAILQADPRDRASLSAIPNLRQI